MISDPEDLEVSSWPLVHSGHHCPPDPFKIRKLGHLPLSLPRLDLGGLSRSHPISDPCLHHPLHPWAPHSAQTRALAGLCWWRLMISVPQPLPRKPEPQHKYLVILLGLVCWEKPTLSFKSPPRIKTGVKITSQSLTGHLATFIRVFGFCCC